MSDTNTFGNPVAEPDPGDGTSPGDGGNPPGGSRARRPLVVVLVLLLLAVLAVGGAWLVLADTEDTPPDAAAPVAPAPVPSEGADSPEGSVPSGDEGPSAGLPEDAPPLESGANVRDPFEPLVADTTDQGTGLPADAAPPPPGTSDPGVTDPGTPGGGVPPGSGGQPGVDQPGANQPGANQPGTELPGDEGLPGAGREPGNPGTPGAGGDPGGAPGGREGKGTGQGASVSVLRVVAVEGSRPGKGTGGDPEVTVTVDGTTHHVAPRHAFAHGFYLRGVYDGRCGVFRYDGGTFFDLCVGQSREVRTDRR